MIASRFPKPFRRSNPNLDETDMRINRDLATPVSLPDGAGGTSPEGQFRCLTVFQHVSNLACKTLLRERFLQQRATLLKNFVL
jgi:hypothetical protein